MITEESGCPALNSKLGQSFVSAARQGDLDTVNRLCSDYAFAPPATSEALLAAANGGHYSVVRNLLNRLATGSQDVLSRGLREFEQKGEGDGKLKGLYGRYANRKRHFGTFYALDRATNRPGLSWTDRKAAELKGIPASELEEHYAGIAVGVKLPPLPAAYQGPIN